MAEQSSPLLELIKEQGKVDDLQYEEVMPSMAAPQNPSPDPAGFWHPGHDSILQIEADYLGTEVVPFATRNSRRT